MLVARPSASTLSSVNTWALACGSIRTLRLRGRMSPASMDLAAFICQVRECQLGLSGRDYQRQ